MSASIPSSASPLLPLRAVPAFAPLPLPLLGVLARESVELASGPGTQLRTADEEAESVLVIVDGRVRVEGAGPAVEMGAGRTIGLFHVLAGERGGLGIRALEPTTVLSLDADGLRHAAERHTPILLRLAETVAGEVVRMPEVETRVARAPEGVTPTAPGMQRVERLLALHRAPRLPSDSMDALAELSAVAREVTATSGQELVPPSRSGEGMWVVCGGRVVRRDAPGGSSDVFGPGSVIGLPQLVLGESLRGRVAADDEALALWIEREVVLDVFEDHFELAWEIVARMAGDLVDAGTPGVHDPPPGADS